MHIRIILIKLILLVIIYFIVICIEYYDNSMLGECNRQLSFVDRLWVILYQWTGRVA